MTLLSGALLALLALLAAVAVPSARSLTVHLVSHTHDDVGWLSTVDQYYIQTVQHIITSMVLALERVPERKFTYVEQAYFQRWWRQQNDQMKNLTRRLVAEKRLEFANGGWCMHDEATTHYVDMIDQTTLGHQYIKSEFGESANPRIGWQLDPFGHSATQAWLLSAEAGFDGLFFGRIDYQDHDLRVARKDLQFIWAPSQSRPQSSVYTEASLDGNYNPPDGLCWDPLCNPFGGGPTEGVQDRHDLEDYNVQPLVDRFIQRAVAMAATHKGEFETQNIMWLMGSDFMYEDAEIWFINLDKIIKAVNLNGTVKTRYSTPSEYVAAKRAEGITYSVKTDDFFPYISDPQSPWTGFFTSRPGLKGYVRSSSVLLAVARQLEVLGGSGMGGSGTEPLWEALSVAQHHDGITGTELDWVSADYAMRIASGAVVAYETLDNAFSQLASNGSSEQAAMQYTSCPLLNLTSCPPIYGASSYTVLLWNPQGRPVQSVINLPVFNLRSGTVTVRDAAGKKLARDVLAVYGTAASLLLKNDSTTATASVSFVADVPALGYAAYSVTNDQEAATAPPKNKLVKRRAGESADFNLENEGVRLTFDTTTGLITQWTDKRTSPPTVHKFSQNFMWYEASNTSSAGCSNAYYFVPQPNTTIMTLVNRVPSLWVGSKGSVVQQVTQVWSSGLSQVVRLYSAGENAASDMVEFEWTLGPVNVSDQRAKEVVIRYNTDLATRATFHTDSNGREFQTRVRDQRPSWNWTNVAPVAGNYYPISTALTMDDGTTGLGIVVDRAGGAASLHDGEVEIMVHRRVIYGCGLSVGLNEAGQNGTGLIITGTHRVFLGPTKATKARPSVIERVRVQQQRQYFPLHPVFAASASDSLPASNSFVATPLPPNVEMQTLQQLGDGNVMLRLTHSFAVNESSQWSGPVTVDLAKLFQQPITSVKRMTLTGNAEYKDKEEEPSQSRHKAAASRRADDTSVTVGPMEIATFFVEMQQQRDE